MNISRRHPNLYIVLAVVMISLAVIVFVGPASAGGAMQISGIGYFAEEGECTDIPLVEIGEGGPNYAIRLAGDLVGCNYVTVLEYASSPSGTYREWGTEHYEIEEGSFGPGMFETTYLVTVKFDEIGNEIWGRCQHPIVAGSGTGVFTGVTGRLDYKDDVSGEVFEAPYRGHLRW